MEFHHNNIFVASKIDILYISRGTQEWIIALKQMQRIKKENEKSKFKPKMCQSFFKTQLN